MIHSAGPDPSPRGPDPSRGPDSSRGALIRPAGPWSVLKALVWPAGPCSVQRALIHNAEPRYIPRGPDSSCRALIHPVGPWSVLRAAGPYSVPRVLIRPAWSRNRPRDASGPPQLKPKQAAYLSYEGGGKRYVGPRWFLFDDGQWPWPECPPPPFGPPPHPSRRALARPGGPWRVLKDPDASRRALIRHADSSSSRGPWSIPPAMMRLVRPQFVPRGPAPSRFLIRLIMVLIRDWIHGALIVQ